MQNEELLEKIEGLFNIERKYTNRLISEVEKNLSTKIATVEMKVEIVNKRAETIEKNLNQSIEDNANFFQEASIVLDKIKNELLHRIKEIEKFINFPSTSKN